MTIEAHRITVGVTPTAPAIGKATIARRDAWCKAELGRHPGSVASGGVR